MSARLLGVLLAIPLLASVSFAQSPPVSLCFKDADNFPWHVKGGHGLSNQLLDMAAARSGVKIEQTGLPWKRCLLDVASGNQAGAFGASFTEERAAFGVYPTTADGKPDPLRRLKTDSYRENLTAICRKKLPCTFRQGLLQPAQEDRRRAVGRPGAGP